MTSAWNLLRWKRAPYWYGIISFTAKTKNYSFVIVKEGSVCYRATCRSMITKQIYNVGDTLFFHSLKKAKEACEEKANILER